MFKVGDFIRYIKGKTKTTAKVEIINQIPNYIGVSTGENVHIDECEIWQPKEGEWCWEVKKDRIVILDYALIKFKFNMNDFDDEFEYRYEPFIGELPTFLKEK